MGGFVLLGGAGVTAFVLWCVTLLWRTPPWPRPPHLEAGGVTATAALTDVDVIVPARNEAEVLPMSLAALLHQGQGLRILLVDDESTDATAELAGAARDRGDASAEARGCLEVIRGGPRPPGWTGKLWALEQARARATRPYTLLVDADVALEPGMVAALRERLEKDDLSLVSVLASPPLEGLAERLLMPAYAFFFDLLYPFRRANDPASRVAAAAGGCLLIRSRLLHELDAFRSIRAALIDDCALARLVKRSGARTWIGLTHGARGLRDSGGWRGIRDLVARNAYTQLHYSPPLLALTSVAMTLMFVVPVAGLALLPAPAGWLALGACAAMALSYLPTLRYYRCSPWWAAMLPGVALAYLAMVWCSAWRFHVRGQRAAWRGRVYATGAAR